MIGGLAALGFDTICATPHQKAGQFLPSLDTIDEAHQLVVTQTRTSGVNVSIPLAAENMWDAVFFERFQAKRIPSYDRGSAFLVEFRPAEMPPGVLGHLFRMRTEGKLPVIAHPERYQALWTDKGLLEQMAAQCAMVVDLAAVAGYAGRRQAKVARKWLKQGVAHAVASDSHSRSDIGVAAEGMAWIRKKLGESSLHRLLADHPRRILAGQHPDRSGRLGARVGRTQNSQ